MISASRTFHKMAAANGPIPFVRWRDRKMASIRRHRTSIKCRVYASLLSCSRMRYAGTLSAGIITNCRLSFGQARAAALAPSRIENQVSRARAALAQKNGLFAD